MDYTGNDILPHSLLPGPTTGVSFQCLFVPFKHVSIFKAHTQKWAFPGGSDGKVFACNVGDLSLIPGLGRSPGRGHGNPLQCSCLENPHG